MEIDHTCANPACSCRVGHAGDYCSDACRDNAENDDPKAPCMCGHADCGTSTPEARGVPDQNRD